MHPLACQHASATCRGERQKGHKGMKAYTTQVYMAWTVLQGDNSNVHFDQYDKGSVHANIRYIETIKQWQLQEQ